jgi:hypothetical protein
MVSTKEFAIVLGGAATGILGYAIAKVFKWGYAKNPAIDTGIALGMVGGAVGSQAYLPEEIGHENALLFINSMIGTAGLLKLFDTHSSSIQAGIAQLAGMNYAPPMQASQALGVAVQPAQMAPPENQFRQETPGLFF